MNFQDLLAKMQQLDQPAVEQISTEGGCGMPAPTMNNEPPVAPPSMSINLNAQGMENIEDLMKLVTKVNPDMDKPAMPPLPALGGEPSIMSIKPSLPPLKMLPDFDAENDDMAGGEKDHEEPDADNFGGPSDNDADNKPADDEKKDKEEAFANSMGDSEPEMMDVDAAIPDGNDLHKKKDMFKAAAGGDNPMAAESTDLRTQIRTELLRRLEEAKAK